MKHKTIAIIPARGGSKRLLNKNTLLLNGIPLLAHSILYARANTDIIDAIYVSTNDAAIKEIALQYGANVIDRPENLATDLEPTITTLQHVLETIEAENVMLLQPTNPLRPIDLLNECWQKYTESASDSLFTVSQNHQKFGKIVNNCFVPFNYSFGQRSQDLEPLFFENGLLYITKVAAIRKGEIITQDAIPFIVHHIFGTVDIDTQDDLDYADYLLKKNTNP